MTTTVASRARPVVAPWAAPALISVSLAGVVALRWLLARASTDPYLVAWAFAGGLVAIAFAGRAAGGAIADASRSQGVRAGAVALGSGIGVVVGLGLVALALAGRPEPAPVRTLAAAQLPAWAAATLAVASAEELLLRGALFGRLRRLTGPLAAVVATAALFALIHVPAYGWHVVPLDLGVGVVLGGLRVATGGLAAPIAAHAVADLATWWL